MNKKGAEMTIGTLVIIVLAIIVLVVIALGFGTGWSNLWSKISGYFSPVNVDSVKQACAYACTTQAENDYCCRLRDVRFSDTEKRSTTCNVENSLKPADCTMNCDSVMCSNACPVSGVKDAVKDGDKVTTTAALVCTGTDKSKPTGKVDATKTLTSDKKPLTVDQVCCLAA